ncbi:MAG: threonine/serine dehydratase [Candidatus Melainabacteria bacterium]|nr:threonine/serine dehydratase [Candidatus Melainabacteria bacterium]
MIVDRVSLSDVLVAQKRIKPFVLNTALAKSFWLSELTQAEVWLKLENLQNTRSFKLRGALNAMSWAREKGMVKCFSSSIGNHALAMAQASQFTDREVSIVVPENVSPKKLKELDRYSVGIVKHGDEASITELFARRLAAEKKGLYISPYNNPEVICGQGTVALEMFERVPKLSTIICAVGGGGLISGIATVAKTINPGCRIVGVVPSAAPGMHRAVTSGRIQQSVQNYTLAEALSLNLEEDTITLPLVQELVDEWVTIDEADIASTMFEFLDHEGMLIEGAAACAVAAIAKKVINFKPREKVAVIICGGNVNRNDWREVVVDHLVGASRSA